MKTYIVTWEIELDADTPRAAAKEALETLRDPLYSTAIVFLVSDPKELVTHIIDLEGIIEDHIHTPLRCPYCGSSTTNEVGYDAERFLKEHTCLACDSPFWTN